MTAGSVARHVPASKEKQDELIMATNNSCIVSKRSVEKLYYKNDYGFLRPFVKKFQRRSPLINRGYWLRMRIIENEVVDFLSNPTYQKKAIVNLGCGYDPLPFKLLAERSDTCRNSLFVDVDHRELILKKCAIVRSTPNMIGLIATHPPTTEDVVLQGDRYCAVACDLGDVGTLEQILRDVSMNVDAVLFVAEVSLTYMDVEAADAIIKYTATFPNARFCLLEQFLPDGQYHPFTETMLSHFNKLQSPLKSALRYESLKSQEERFKGLQWHYAHARTLWDMWGDDNLLSSNERETVDFVEPFDEWEEFALFASHYFLLVADSESMSSSRSLDDTMSPLIEPATSEDSMFVTFSAHESAKGRRRFGALWNINIGQICHHGGHGTQGRLSDADTYITSEIVNNHMAEVLAGPPAELTCHTISNLHGSEALLVGGRRSPDRASSACFLWQDGKWQKDEHLPHGLFRHCAVTVSDPRSASKGLMVLVFGGKASGKAQDHWLLWEPIRGWEQLDVPADRPCPRFGACMSTSYDSLTAGIITGGLTQDGRVLSDTWRWELIVDPNGKLRIACYVSQTILRSQLDSHSVGRYGATLIPLTDGFLLIGGIQARSLTQHGHEILKINDDLSVNPISLIGDVPRLMPIGCSATRVKGNDVLIVGGGAVCFSFGSFWNSGSYLVGTLNRLENPWFIDDKKNDPTDGKNSAGSSYINKELDSTMGFGHGSKAHGIRHIPRIPSSDSSRVSNILQRDAPIVIENANIGRCTESWTHEYLRRAVGSERKVVVHCAETDNMNFLSKNFKYSTQSFGEFLDSVDKGGKMYLRSLSLESPTDKPANLEDDFPSIASDFQLPPELDHVKDHVHSSPLRISGPVAMWLHYDVMANVLCQVGGSKKLILYPPSEIRELRIPPGASSSPLNVFEPGDYSPSKSGKAYEAVLHPGDILFIPPLWAHAASPVGGSSIAVNVFFRNLQQGYAAGKDVYGNRDLQAYENGRKDIQRIKKSFRGLPQEVGKFYLRRLAAELAEIADSY